MNGESIPGVGSRPSSMTYLVGLQKISRLSLKWFLIGLDRPARSGGTDQSRIPVLVPELSLTATWLQATLASEELLAGRPHHCPHLRYFHAAEYRVIHAKRDNCNEIPRVFIHFDRSRVILSRTCNLMEQIMHTRGNHSMLVFTTSSNVQVLRNTTDD